MQTLTVTTDTTAHATILANFLKTVPYIKSVVTEKTDDTINPLTAADWVRPGRPATEEELEQLAIEMENDNGEYSAEEVFDSVKKELKQWRAKHK